MTYGSFQTWQNAHVGIAVMIMKHLRLVQWDCLPQSILQLFHTPILLVWLQVSCPLCPRVWSPLLARFLVFNLPLHPQKKTILLIIQLCQRLPHHPLPLLLFSLGRAHRLIIPVRNRRPDHFMFQARNRQTDNLWARARSHLSDHLLNQ